MRQEGMRGLVRGRKVRTTIWAKDEPPGPGPAQPAGPASRSPNRAWVTDFTFADVRWVHLTSRSRSTCTRGR